MIVGEPDLRGGDGTVVMGLNVGFDVGFEEGEVRLVGRLVPETVG